MGRPPVVVEVVPFFEEADLLAARAELMAGVVDVIVPIEADRTFQGAPKPFHLQEPGAVPAGQVADVIPYLFRFPPEAETWSAWDRERYQRDQAWAALDSFELFGGHETLVLSADLDEFITPARVARIAEVTEDGPVVLGMRNVIFGGWENPETLWHARAFRTGPGVRWPWPAEGLHHLHAQQLPGVLDCGWHLTWLGDVDRRRRKAEAFSHDECQPGGAIWPWIEKGRPMPVGTPHVKFADHDALPAPLRRLVGDA